MQTMPAAADRQLRISQPTKVLLLILTLTGLAGSLSNIFVNVYLYKMSEHLYKVFFFHLLSYLIWVPVYVGAGWLSKRVDRRRILTIGLVFYLIFYAAVLMAGERLGPWNSLTGLIYGTAGALYWFSVNLLVIDYTTKENRDWFNGLSGVVGPCRK
jgi:YQGE family putative transporter